MAPLTGIRVVDFGRVLAGPHCAQTLLDLGAEVIKIEPPSGDIARRAFPRRGEISGYYAQQNAGKRNISIDLNVEGHARSRCGYATRPTSSWRIPPGHPGLLRAGIRGRRGAQSWCCLRLHQRLRPARTVACTCCLRPDCARRIGCRHDRCSFERCCRTHPVRLP